ncbi:MAG: hypothetical protein IKI36_04750 [Prevotella sp.]|nr:hypothetical protein [Prevotella sp.]
MADAGCAAGAWQGGSWCMAGAQQVHDGAPLMYGRCAADVWLVLTVGVWLVLVAGAWLVLVVGAWLVCR